MRNAKPKRLPLYEPIIGTGTMERILGNKFANPPDFLSPK